MKIQALMKRIIPINMRKLFFPFVGLMIGVVAAYSFLNWLFIVRTSQFLLNLVWIETWIPAAISACIVRYWVMPKLCNIDFIVNEHKKCLVPVIAFFILIVTLHFTQIWVESYCAKMYRLNRISEVHIEPKKRFYQIREGYYVDKALMSYYDYEYSCGGRQPDYCSEIYVVSPIYEKKNEMIRHAMPTAWLGVLFKNKAPTRSYRDEFFVRTMQYLEVLDLNAFYYLERKTNSNLIQDDSLERFQFAINNGHYAFTSQKNPLVLLANYRLFSERVRDDTENAVGIWIFAVLTWFGVVYLLTGKSH